MEENEVNKINQVGQTKEFRPSFTPAQKHEYRKMSRRMRRKLVRAAKKFKPWEYDYLLELINMALNYMFEYYMLGVNVLQCTEEQCSRRTELVEALNLLFQFREDDTQEKLKAFCDYISENLLKWWD